MPISHFFSTRGPLSASSSWASARPPDRRRYRPLSRFVRYNVISKQHINKYIHIQSNQSNSWGLAHNPVGALFELACTAYYIISYITSQRNALIDSKQHFLRKLIQLFRIGHVTSWIISKLCGSDPVHFCTEFQHEVAFSEKCKKSALNNQKQ